MTVKTSVSLGRDREGSHISFGIPVLLNYICSSTIFQREDCRTPLPFHPRSRNLPHAQLFPPHTASPPQSPRFDPTCAFQPRSPPGARRAAPSGITCWGFGVGVGAGPPQGRVC